MWNLHWSVLFLLSDLPWAYLRHSLQEEKNPLFFKICDTARGNFASHLFLYQASEFGAGLRLLQFLFSFFMLTKWVVIWDRMFYWNRIWFPRGMWYVMGTKTRVATDWGRSQGVYTSLRETARKLPKRLRDIPDKTARKKQTESRETKLLYWTIKFFSHISLRFALLSFEALIWWFTFFFTIITTK